MIFGIKQIEKQFPGFEARFTCAQLYDMRELFDKYVKIDEENAVEFSNEIDRNYPDLLRPPSKLMYLVIGRVKPDAFGETQGLKISTEYAIMFSEKPVGLPGIFIDRLYVADFIHTMNNAVVVKKYDGLAINDEKYKDLGAYWSLYEKDPKVFQKRLFGNVPHGVQLTPDDLKLITEDDLGLFVTQIKIALFHLNVRNIKKQTKYISQQRGFYYPKAWGREYKVLSLSQTLLERSPGPNLPPGYHVRGHFQRGHFKRKPHGVYWWNDHWRGDFSKGIVMKDYKAGV